jgi:hypothetical protein
MEGRLCHPYLENRFKKFASLYEVHAFVIGSGTRDRRHAAAK